MRLKFIGAGLVLAALALVAVPALAGGWAVATLDDLPVGVVAGRPVQVGFVVRQHGVSPWEADYVLVRARPATGGPMMEVQARREGEPGHYAATLTLPRAGSWDWFIDTGIAETGQPMPPLWVAQSSLTAGRALIVAPRVLLTHDGAVAAAAFAARRGGGLVADEATGEALFVAKGCVVCHNHTEMTEVRSAWRGLEVGPNLTQVARDAPYLREWLKDPAAMKPGTLMPTLGLSDTEIEALITFLQPLDTAAGR